jgi:hypothetical protein
MRSKLGELFFLSHLEKGRTPEPAACSRELRSFENLGDVIASSLLRQTAAAPQLQAQISVGKNPLLHSSEAAARAFQDQNLLQKLIQYRNQIPVSHRIIRAPRS